MEGTALESEDAGVGDPHPINVLPDQRLVHGQAEGRDVRAVAAEAAPRQHLREIESICAQPSLHVLAPGGGVVEGRAEEHPRIGRCVGVSLQHSGGRVQVPQFQQ